MSLSFPQALTIAGSDSGGGAGIQADLKTFQERRVFGMSVITALTAQNTLGVHAVCPVSLDMIKAQLAAIGADFTPRAYKIGMLGNAEIIACIADALSQYRFGMCVLDPVMIAKGGAPLLEQSAIEILKKRLLPYADVLTPNIPEAEHLTGISVCTEADIRQAARILQDMGAKTIVIKGGHAQGKESTDWVFTPQHEFALTQPRVDTQHTHGTGCTFSACITAELAKGQEIKNALSTAKAFISAAIKDSPGIGHGHGPTNHWAYRDNNHEMPER